MTKQKTAVVNAILSELKTNDIDYKLGGEVNVSDVLTKEMRLKVQSVLCEGFMNNMIDISESADVKHRPNEFKSYVNGLVNNWVRKNPEFNGGQSYKPANPGSRAGQSDEQIKNLRLMKKTMTDEKVIAEIDKAIQDRLAEIKPEAVVTVNADAIPEHLRHLIK